MIINVCGNLIETNYIYKIGEIYDDSNRICDIYEISNINRIFTSTIHSFYFEIHFLNQKKHTVYMYLDEINGWENEIIMYEYVSTVGYGERMFTEEGFRIFNEKFSKINKLREDIAKFLHDNPSTIKTFDFT